MEVKNSIEALEDNNTKEEAKSRRKEECRLKRG